MRWTTARNVAQQAIQNVGKDYTNSWSARLNRAIEEYRQSTRYWLDYEFHKKRLEHMVVNLDEVEMKDYVEQTTAIEEECEKAWTDSVDKVDRWD